MDEDTLLEIEAALSAQRFLIEHLYAQSFAADPAGLSRVMQELLRLTRGAATASAPTEKDTMIELQARMATHLQRFETSVLARIASGRRV